MDPDEPEPEPFELRPIEIALLEFCIDLLRQKIRNDEYGCALICATAVLGCGPFGWATPENFPPKISSIIKISRFLVLHKALRLDPQSVEIRRGFAGQNSQRWFPGDMVELDDEYIYEADEGYNSAPPSPSPMARSPQPSSPMLGRFTQEQRHHPQRTFPEWVKYMVDTFMVRGTNGPVQWLLDLRTYGMKVFFNTPAEGHIGWKSGDELLYKQIHFTMGDFRGFVHGLVGRMRQQLVEELMFCSETAPPVIPWEGLYDDPTQNAPGWSFIRDIRTRWPVDGDEWLIQRVRREPALRQRFVQPDGQGFRMHAIDRLFRVVSQFRERLAVAIHISAGQPSRGPELMSIRHRNSERERRNIFIEDRMVVFVSRYHKGFHVHNDTKVIFRYLPRELGELVVWYLWLVLPFIEQIQSYQRHFRGAPPAVSRRAEYIWSPDPDRETEWTGHRLREVLKRETALGLRGQRLHLQSYRDIAIAISRRYLRRSSQFQQNADDDQPGDGDVFDMDDEAAIDPDESMGFVADLQAGHSAHIAGMIYGRQMMEPTDSTMRHRQLFRQSSQDWHNFLAFRSIRERQEQPVTIGKRKRNPWEDEATEGRVERRYELQQCDMGEAFQHMMGADIPFRSIQAPVLQAIKHGVSPIVAVMPTGGGKSILFMLPAWVGSGGLTIVVVPLIALRGDMQQRCQQLGILCAVWDRRRPPDGASIVLVTPEGAENDEFIGFVSRQRMLQRLDRIVIDECHIVLNPNGRFRPLLQQLGKLRTAETQMILLTATLPPETEPTLFRRMGWERDQVALYRGRTCRHNVAYRVHTIPTDEGYDHPFQWVVMPSVVEFIRDRIRRACPGRVIIYGTVKAHITQLAEQLDCPAFHASQVDKDGILAWFRRTPGAVITATSALGMGIDIPDIRSVIHIGQPRTMLDYAQESGRAGRDGQPSEAIIIQAEGTMVGRETRPFWMQDEPAGEHPRVIEYIEAGASGCRRVVLDGYLDGEMDGYQRQRCGDQVEEAVCDGCQPEWQDHEPPFPEEIPGKVDAIDVTIRPDIEDTIPPGSPTAPSAKPPVPIAARHEFRQQDIQRAQFASRFPAASGHGFQDEEFLVEEVQRWVDRCWTCAQAGRDDGHELYRCFSGPAAERPVVEANRQWMKKIRGEIKYTGYTAHFWCGMPQDICPRANPKERNDEGTKQRCDGYRTALIPTLVMMVYGPYADPEVQERWFQRLGEQGVQNARENQAGLIGYLEQAAPNTAKKRTQLTEEFIWLRRAYQGREIGSI